MDSLEVTCLMCPRKTSWHCSGCSKEARYCSIACQVHDHPVHKQFCSALRNFQRLHAANLKRCVFFPGGDKPGTFVWAEVIDGLPGETLDEHPFFGLNATSTKICVRNLVQGRKCQRNDLEEIQIVSKRHFQNHPVNQGLCQVARAGRVANRFRGPVLVTRVQNAGRTDQKYADVDMRDIRNAADFISCHDRKNSTIGNHVCNATFASSLGDLENSTQPDFFRQEIYSKDRDEAYQKQGSAIANLLGIPIQPMGRKFHQLHGFKYRPEQKINSISATLMLDLISPDTRPAQIEGEQGNWCPPLNHFRSKFRCIERGTGGFGTSLASATDQGGIGFVRSDGKDLLPEHLETLCSYINCKVVPRVRKALTDVTDGQSVVGRDEVLERTSKADFMNFWEAFRTDNGWSDVPSPYDV